jgi:hypothetical protein
MRRIGWIGFAALVALGLLWSAAATSKLVPMPSAEISSASMREAVGGRVPFSERQQNEGAKHQP